MEGGAAQPVGFIGVGNMGGAMAHRLLNAGYRLLLCDTNPAALEPLIAQGAEVASSPREIADRAEIVFACLPSPKVSMAVALGENGIVSGAKTRIYVETSTLGVATVKQIGEGLAGSGKMLVDAPISGGPLGAKNGTLSMMLAGSAKATDAISAMLPHIAKNIFNVGAQPGLGQICKVINNAISITGTTIACEAVVLGVKAGMDAHTLVDVLNASTGRNSATANKFPRHILPRTFDSGAPIEIGAKDIGLYLAEAERLGLPSLVGSSISQIWRMALSEGAGKNDITSLITMFEQWADVEVGGAKNT